jgi:transcriptional regulator with XRE-family HTH domain
MEKLLQFRDNLKAARRAAGLTQQQLADMIGASVKTLGGWEVGTSEPSLKMVATLADKLNVTVDYLLGRQAMDLEDVNLLKIAKTFASLETDSQTIVETIADKLLQNQKPIN